MHGDESDRYDKRGRVSVQAGIDIPRAVVIQLFDQQAALDDQDPLPHSLLRLPQLGGRLLRLDDSGRFTAPLGRRGVQERAEILAAGASRGRHQDGRVRSGGPVHRPFVVVVVVVVVSGVVPALDAMGDEYSAQRQGMAKQTDENA